AEWVSPIADSWIPTILENQEKISYTYRPWGWLNQNDPQAYLGLVFNPQNDPIENSVQRIGELNLLINPVNEYAVVQTDTDMIVCEGTSTGGIIEINCDNPVPGNLVVLEHYYSGWTAEVNGNRVEFEYSPWLSIDLPPGENHIRFVYRPWDVWIGLILTLLGIGLCIYLSKSHYLDPTNQDQSPEDTSS
ncbi:MAG TPA: hypothetical protein VN376_03865, partial [Longilinea sp.]|nr:hypothetical protein [Longilinea sp.]